MSNIDNQIIKLLSSSGAMSEVDISAYLYQKGVDPNKIKLAIGRLIIADKLIIDKGLYSKKGSKLKYNNVKTELDGHVFDSRGESERYQELKMLEKADEVSEIELQPSFKLVDGLRWKGKKLQSRYYIADFKYKDKSGRWIVEDFKSKKTATLDLYTLKRLLFLNLYPEYIFVETIY